MNQEAFELTIRISGEAGQGMQTIGAALQKTFKNCGLSVFSIQDNMSRIRGGNNSFQLRIAARPVAAPRGRADILVALDKASVALQRELLLPQGILILDREKFKINENNPSFFDAPIYRLAAEQGGSEIYINSVACGVLGGITKIDLKFLTAAISDTFAKKEQAIIEKNIKALEAGYNYALDNFKPARFKIDLAGIPGKSQQLILNGTEAVALGAVRAGCKFYSGYPMSPSTGIMENMAKYLPSYQGIVEQAEDEIAAVNMVIGASYAGVRAMTATSGGGFCLMVEGLSLACMTETPLVVVNAQRPGPATGFPTRTEQGDLDFLLSAGHGEFARVIYSPGTLAEVFYLTGYAFDIAEKYQIPVIIMLDQYLADSAQNIDKLDPLCIAVKRSILSKAEGATLSNYKRYALTADGVSPRGIPSWLNDPICADSDEHNEEGHITEEAELRIHMVNKRFAKKMTLLQKEIVPPRDLQHRKGGNNNFGIWLNLWRDQGSGRS